MSFFVARVTKKNSFSRQTRKIFSRFLLIANVSYMNLYLIIIMIEQSIMNVVDSQICKINCRTGYGHDQTFFFLLAK